MVSTYDCFWRRVNKPFWQIWPVLGIGSLLLTPAYAQSGGDERVEHQHVAGNVHMLYGGGGANISLSVGPDGVLMVDSKGPRVYRQITAIVESLSDGPVRYLINGHEHPDHTGGNENFGKRGVTIIAARAVRDVLAAGQRGGPPAPAAALPILTFPDGGGLSIEFNGERIEVFHVEPAHAPGNSIVHYTGSNVLHLGDIFSPTRYPIIAGGSFEAFIRAMDTAIRRASFETKVIPGSGPVSDREGMIEYREMLLLLRDRANEALDQGRTLEEFVASAPTREYDATYGDPGHELFLPIVYQQMAARRQ